LFGYALLRSKGNDQSFDEVATAIGTKSLMAHGVNGNSASYMYSDNDVQAGVTYYYKLVSIDNDGSRTVHGQVAMATPRMPSNFSLSAYPNPLSLSAAQAGTKLSFSVASGANVRVTIVDLSGRTVRTLIDTHVDARSQVIERNA